jgi:hypothetical protein
MRIEGREEGKEGARRQKSMASGRKGIGRIFLARWMKEKVPVHTNL